MDTQSISYLVVHGIEAVGRYDVPGMDEAVQRAGALGEVGVVGIIRSDAVQNKIETVGEVGNARPQAVQVEPVLDVRALHLAEHLVALEAAEPLDPGLVVAGRRGILVVGHYIYFCVRLCFFCWRLGSVVFLASYHVRCSPYTRDAVPKASFDRKAS